MSGISKSKTSLLFCITALILLGGCKVSKNISKQETQKEEASKVDSSGFKKTDVTKETKAVTEITEVIDSSAFITPDGKLITNPEEVTKESIKVPIKKKKTTKRTEDIKETDQSKSDVKVKKQEKKEETKKETVKVIEKTSLLPGWAWWLIALLILITLAWRFRKSLYGFLPFK